MALISTRIAPLQPVGWLTETDTGCAAGAVWVAGWLDTGCAASAVWVAGWLDTGCAAGAVWVAGWFDTEVEMGAGPVEDESVIVVPAVKANVRAA